MNALKILLIEGSKHQLLATDEGVFYRTNAMNTWVKLNTKLPNAHVIDIEYDAYDQTLYAATFGNGVWKLDFGVFLEEPK